MFLVLAEPGAEVGCEILQACDPSRTLRPLLGVSLCEDSNLLENTAKVDTDDCEPIRVSIRGGTVTVSDRTPGATRAARRASSLLAAGLRALRAYLDLRWTLYVNVFFAVAALTGSVLVLPRNGGLGAAGENVPSQAESPSGANTRESGRRSRPGDGMLPRHA